MTSMQFIMGLSCHINERQLVGFYPSRRIQSGAQLSQPQQVRSPKSRRILCGIMPSRGCGWETRAPTFGQHAQWGALYHGCQGAT
jgi:hypothetical protein